MEDLIKLSLAETVEGLRAKRFSSRQVTEAYLDRIAAENGKLNAYLEVFEDALAQADLADARRARALRRPDFR
jgi:aspartyl-tRNA(Asn)/glutamyl-tRNA(Gln) amidotransferase subunit A